MESDSPEKMDRSQRILDLCEALVAAASRLAGGGDAIAFGDQTEQHRLLQNGLWPHDLSHSELVAACIGLTHTLIFPGMNTIVLPDHIWFWAWCGEAFASHTSEYFTESDREVRERFSLAVRAALAGSGAAQGFAETGRANRLLDIHSHQLLLHRHEVLVHLAFPLLEGILRKSCAAFVDYDGNVLQSFVVGRQQYGPLGSKGSRRCSNLGHMLHLLRDQVAPEDLRGELDLMGTAIVRLGASDPWTQLFDWRNSTLHGATSFATIGGTVLNTAILIVIAAFRLNYDSRRQYLIQRIQREAQMVHMGTPRSPWSYYPPN